MRFFRQLCLEKGSLMVSDLLLCNETEQAASGVFPSKGLGGIWSSAVSSSWPEGIHTAGPSALAQHDKHRVGQSWKGALPAQGREGQWALHSLTSPPHPATSQCSSGSILIPRPGTQLNPFWGYFCGDSLFQCHSAASSWMQSDVTAWNQIASDDLTQCGFLGWFH